MTCAIEGCDKPVYRQRRGWCQMHYTRWKRHGDPLTFRPTGNQSGPDHPCWKGDEITYDQAHRRVVKVRGRAAEHACTCGLPAQEWAYDHADPAERIGQNHGIPCPYSTDPMHYIAMCISCHRRFDHPVRRIAS